MAFLLTLYLSESAFAGEGLCASWDEPLAIGVIQNASLDEVSGAAASPDGGALWVHDDSGGSAALYAMDLGGAPLGAWTLAGAENDDWEDLALGPCPTDPGCACLYAADIGDNDEARGGGALYRVPEPAAGESGEISPEVIWFAYPDGAHDAEALLVHPVTGEVLVVTKDDPARLFRFPDAPPAAAPASAPVTLEDAGALDLAEYGAAERRVTAGDVSPGGGRVVIRTDGDLLVFDVPEGGLAAALANPAQVVPAPLGEGGEAVAFAAEGDALWLTGEGEGATLWAVRCADFEDAGAGALETCDAVDAPPEEGCGGCGAQAAPRALWLLALAPLVARRR